MVVVDTAPPSLDPLCECFLFLTMYRRSRERILHCAPAPPRRHRHEDDPCTIKRLSGPIEGEGVVARDSVDGPIEGV